MTRSGLVSSLRRLFAMREQGAVDFDQVIIETLPDADPAPVMQTLLNNALVTEYFRLDSVVVAMPVGGTETLAETRYGTKQLALADRIVIDPGDLAEGQLARRLTHLNPAAEFLSSDGDIQTPSVLGAGLEAHLLRGDLDRWLAQSSYAKSDGLERGLHGFAIQVDAPLDWDAFHGWLNAGTQSNGDFLYRTKGALKIEGLSGPVLINGAQYVFQPPCHVPDLTIERSSLLFITDDLDRDAVQDSLREDLPQFGRISAARAQRAVRAAMDPSIPL